MSEAWEWVVAASKASVEALAERVAKLEVGRAELHDRCDGLSDAIGSLEAYVSKNGVLCDAAPLASGQPASAGEATVPPGWKLAPGWRLSSYGADGTGCSGGKDEHWGESRAAYVRGGMFDRTGACAAHALEMGALVEDEPPAEQPSRQETGGVAGGACADYCGRCGAGDHDASACRDRAKAKAAEQAAIQFTKEDAVALSQAFEDSYSTPPAEPSWIPGELAAEPSGAGKVPSAVRRWPAILTDQTTEDLLAENAHLARYAEKHYQALDRLMRRLDWYRRRAKAWKSLAKGAVVRAELPAHAAGPRSGFDWRPLGCGETSRSSRLACAGNDGGPHDDVCDLVTEALEDQHHRLGAQVAALTARLAQAELFLAVKDKVVAGFEERCKEADKKLAQAERDKASATQSLVDEYDRRKKAERERDAAAEEGRKRHLAAVLRAEETERERDELRSACLAWSGSMADAMETAGRLRDERDEATAKERARCLAWVKLSYDMLSYDSYEGIRSGKPVPGSEVKCDPDPPREVAPDRTPCSELCGSKFIVEARREVITGDRKSVHERDGHCYSTVACLTARKCVNR